MALQGYKAIVKAQSSAVVFTAEATTTSDDLTYQVTDTAKRIFDYDTEVQVYDSAVLTTETYTLSRLNGSVTFDSVDAGRVITITGKYVTLATVGEAKGFSFDGQTDMGDVTVFQDTEREFIPLLRGANITLDKFYATDNYFLDLLTSTDVKVVEFLPDSTDTDSVFRVFAGLTSDGVSSTVEGLVQESVSMQCTDAMIAEA